MGAGRMRALRTFTRRLLCRHHVVESLQTSIVVRIDRCPHCGTAWVSFSDGKPMRAWFAP